MKYFLGLDIGSVNAKVSLVDENGRVVLSDVKKTTSGPKAAVNSLIAAVGEKFGFEQIAAAGVSGTGKAVIPREFGWSEYSSSLAIASGLLHHHPEAGPSYKSADRAHWSLNWKTG